MGAETVARGALVHFLTVESADGRVQAKQVQLADQGVELKGSSYPAVSSGGKTFQEHGPVIIATGGFTASQTLEAG